MATGIVLSTTWGIISPEGPSHHSLIKMIFWPYKKFVIESQLEAKAFSAALLDHSEKGSSGYYWIRSRGKTFTGEANAKEISLIKMVSYWNLSPLKISGKYILDDPLVVEVKMKNPFATPVLIIAIITVVVLYYNYKEDIPPTLIAGIFLTAYFLINIPFQIEAAKAKKILLKIADRAKNL